MTKNKIFYKVVRSDGRGIYSTDFTYDLTGKWMHTTGRLKWCCNGFHVSTLAMLGQWADETGYEIWKVEVKGDTLKPKYNGTTKHIYRSIKFVERIGRYSNDLYREAYNVFDAHSEPELFWGYLLGLIKLNERKKP